MNAYDLVHWLFKLRAEYTLDVVRGGTGSELRISCNNIYVYYTDLCGSPHDVITALGKKIDLIDFAYELGKIS